MVPLSIQPQSPDGMTQQYAAMGPLISRLIDRYICRSRNGFATNPRQAGLKPTEHTFGIVYSENALSAPAE